MTGEHGLWPYWVRVLIGLDQLLNAVAGGDPDETVSSINDHPDIRALFADLPVIEVPYSYTVGGGGRECEAVELIYGNWPEGVPTPKGYQEELFVGIPS